MDLNVSDVPEYLIIGHVARDRGPQGYLLGGTCSYAGLAALRLGRRTAAVTSYGPGLPSLSILEGIRIHNVPAKTCTDFENIYEGGRRRQNWSATAAPLDYRCIPQGWRRAPIVHLAPVAQELSPAMCACFGESLVCVTVQGWLRARDTDGTVVCQPHPELEKCLRHAQVVVFSDADLNERRSELIPLLTSAGLAVETLGPRGCKVYKDGGVKHIPVVPLHEVDATGAGDIFAAAFFVRYWETVDALEAARFANACAALSVQEEGLSGVPFRSAVETYQTLLLGRAPKSS